MALAAGTVLGVLWFTEAPVIGAIPVGLPSLQLGLPPADFLPEADLLPYVESILQVYNAIGRRDNKFKARIKITVGEHGIEAFRQRVEERFRLQRKAFGGADQALIEGIRAMFAAPAYIEASTGAFDAALAHDPAFRSFVDTNLHPHRNPDYAIVTVSLKAHGATPGDATADQMRVIAALAARYGHDETRISHEQNCILPHVHRRDVPAVHAALREANLATANVGLASDIIACPGMDYCNLATARSIPIAQGIASRMKERGDERLVGDLKIKISGCINACGHHHVGHIGILGLDRAGAENYQITLGGDGTETVYIDDSAAMVIGQLLDVAARSETKCIVAGLSDDVAATCAASTSSPRYRPIGSSERSTRPAAPQGRCSTSTRRIGMKIAVRIPPNRGNRGRRARPRNTTSSYFNGDLSSTSADLYGAMEPLPRTVTR